MLQEGILRRLLFSRGSEGLEVLFLPGAPSLSTLFIVFPYPRPAPPSFCLVTRRHSWFLTYHWSRIRSGQQLAGHVAGFGLGKPVSTSRGLLAVKQLQFSDCEGELKKQTRRLGLYYQT